MHCIHNIFLQLSPGVEPGFVISVGALILVLCVFIILHTFVSRHKKNLMVREQHLLKKEFDQELLMNRVAVQEATFESLGKELHDNVGQLLSSAKMLIGLTERGMEHPPVTLLSANETLNKAIIELRSLSKSLNKDWLSQFDFFKNLQDETDRIKLSSIDIVVNKNPELLLPAEEQFILFRVIQEAMQNVIKHSSSSSIKLDIQQEKKNISILIQDSGKGFDIQQPISGVGISNMKQRVKSLGGVIKWTSSAAGTTVLIFIPLK